MRVLFFFQREKPGFEIENFPRTGTLKKLPASVPLDFVLLPTSSSELWVVSF